MEHASAVHGHESISLGECWLDESSLPGSREPQGAVIGTIGDTAVSRCCCTSLINHFLLIKSKLAGLAWAARRWHERPHKLSTALSGEQAKWFKEMRQQKAKLETQGDRMRVKRVKLAQQAEKLLAKGYELSELHASMRACP